MVILAVDDESPSLKLLVEAIKEAIPNINELLSFSNGKDALKSTKNKKIDLAFLDIELGDMSGLSLAKDLKKSNPLINIIFVTGYSQFTPEAIAIHASGYITKPVMSEDIKREYGNLLFPANNQEKEDGKLYCKTFGNFEVFFNHKPLVFERSKSKELLAYLVDREGSLQNRNQLIAILFPDDNEENQNYLTQIWRSLKKSLKAVGQDGVLVKGFNQYGIDITKVDSDLFDYLNGDHKTVNSFRGEYMSQYEWSEFSLDKFYK
jgi:two-component system LytT family response regulator